MPGVRIKNCSLVFSAVFLGQLSCATSAEITPNISGYENFEPENNYISIIGNIETGDRDKLVAALGNVEVQKGEPLYLNLNSRGGNFEEAIKIAQFALDKRLSTRLSKDAECLSACAIIFMAGTRFTTVGSTITRRMHPSAKLGFHAPTLDIRGETSNPAEIREVYDAAVEGIGSQLLAIARFRGRRWNNSLMRPDLINEMMLRRGRNFYYIDTVRKALENDIELIRAGGPTITDQAAKDGCANFLALHTSSKNADETHYGDVKRKRNAGERETVYEIPLSRGQCKAHVMDVYDDMYGGAGTVYVSEINGAEGTGYPADVWAFWPGTKRLDSLPERKDDVISPSAPSTTAALPKAYEPRPAPFVPAPFVPGVSSSWNYPTQQSGEQGALSRCTGSCRIALWFRHACGAIAIGERGGWGTAWHTDGRKAAKNALANCAKFDTNCALKTTVCSPGGYGAIAMQNAQ